MTIVLPLAIGFGFGWLLHKAGLGRFDRIAGLYQLCDLAVRTLLAELGVGVIYLITRKPARSAT